MAAGALSCAGWSAVDDVLVEVAVDQVDDQVAVGELLGGVAQSVRGGLLDVPGDDGEQGSCRGSCPFPD
ncbi:hypothetical protein ACFXMT_11215 [Streptomyces mirabilis]|uniref:hypothetical protein n=1 Tax=Streptomyces mirabilis TaxID=68239 RepID=UPI00365084AE